MKTPKLYLIISVLVTLVLIAAACRAGRTCYRGPSRACSDRGGGGSRRAGAHRRTRCRRTSAD